MTQSIGDRIAWALEQLGNGNTPEARAWLAMRAGVHQTTIDRWIRGDRRPNTENTIAMSDALGVNLRWLFTGEGDPNAVDAPRGGVPSRQPGPTMPRTSGESTERRRGESDRRKNGQG